MKKYTDRGKKDTRSGFGEGLLQAGKADSRVVALTADLKGSLKMDAFAAEFPDRYYECGIAEANMIGTAAGMALTGLVPFAGSFAEFVTGRVYDQIRMEVCYGKANVKIASSHAGITLGEDGATHQTMEDIALMRVLPDMVVINTEQDRIISQFFLGTNAQQIVHNSQIPVLCVHPADIFSFSIL